MFVTYKTLIRKVPYVWLGRLIELTLGYLRYHLTDVPPQTNMQLAGY